MSRFVSVEMPNGIVYEENQKRFVEALMEKGTYESPKHFKGVYFNFVDTGLFVL